MTELSILVVDDEPLARRRIIRVIAGMPGVTLCGEAGNVDEAEAQVRALQPDILLLDVQMPGASGFDLLDRLGADAPATVFVTAFDDHALRAFDASAVDYVTKPIAPGRLTAAIERAAVLATARRDSGQVAELVETVAALRTALRQRQQGPSEFWVKARGEHVRIPAETIVRIQAERDYVRIHTEARSYLFHESLARLEETLEPSEFLRVHRSTIVRRDRIRQIRNAPFASFVLALSDGSEVRVGRTYSKAIRALLLEKRTRD